jgi:hypothetical protein
VKKNQCQYCQRLFIPAFRHPNQTCCGRKKCVLARRAGLQKKKMAEDPVYRQNQKDSNKTWQERNPGYWKKYRENHPDKAEKNRLKQQVRNLKRKKGDRRLVAKTNLEHFAKMVSVNRIDCLQELDLWLVSSGSVIPPIKLALLVKSKVSHSKTALSDYAEHLDKSCLKKGDPCHLD